MRLKIKNNQKGFTIIETMIVLAIVAAITAGIFIMASTLRRNSRDNARLSDIGVVATGIVDYVAGSGSVPEGITGASGTDATRVRIENLTRYEVANINPEALLPDGAIGSVADATVIAGDITILAVTADPINKTGAGTGGCDNSGNTANTVVCVMKVSHIDDTTSTKAQVVVQGVPAEDDLLIVSNAMCAGANKEQVTTTGASSTSVAILYKLEKHNAPQCWQAVV